MSLYYCVLAHIYFQRFYIFYDHFFIYTSNSIQGVVKLLEQTLLPIENVKIYRFFISEKLENAFVYDIVCLIFFKIVYVYYSCFTGEPIYLKFGIFIKLWKLITYCFIEKFKLPNRKQVNSKKKKNWSSLNKALNFSQFST